MGTDTENEAPRAAKDIGSATGQDSKRCGSCGLTKPSSEFNRKRARPDGLQEVCRECNRESSRRYYSVNRERHVRIVVERTARQRRLAKAMLVEYLRAHPCVDCGNSDLRVLDFDHLPHADKRGDVMRLVKDGCSLSTILDEIAKCEVRCRNCHAIVTLTRRGDNWRSRAMSDT